MILLITRTKHLSLATSRIQNLFETHNNFTIQNAHLFSFSNHYYTNTDRKMQNVQIHSNKAILKLNKKLLLDTNLSTLKQFLYMIMNTIT